MKLSNKQKYIVTFFVSLSLIVACCFGTYVFLVFSGSHTKDFARAFSISCFVISLPGVIAANILLYFDRYKLAPYPGYWESSKKSFSFFRVRMFSLFGVYVLCTLYGISLLAQGLYPIIAVILLLIACLASFPLVKSMLGTIIRFKEQEQS